MQNKEASAKMEIVFHTDQKLTRKKQWRETLKSETSKKKLKKFPTDELSPTDVLSVGLNSSVGGELFVMAYWRRLDYVDIKFSKR